jgi:hypothetical protein
MHIILIVLFGLSASAHGKASGSQMDAQNRYETGMTA